jgi:hypothetical protein
MGSLLRLTRATAEAAAHDLNPLVTAQQHSPGVLPGTSANRSTLVDLVHSSVLV